MVTLEGFLNTFIDADISGELIMYFDINALRALGFAVTEAARIIALIKSLVKCYEVRATYFGAEKKKGVRGTIYRHAEEHKAYYSMEYSIMLITVMI